MSLYVQEDAGVDVLLIVNTVVLLVGTGEKKNPPAVDVLMNPVDLRGGTSSYAALYRQRQPYGMLPATKRWEGPKCQQHVMK